MKTKTKEKLETIIAKSSYYYVNPSLTTTNFPIPDTLQEDNWKIITIDKTMTTAEVLAHIKAHGCRPANAYELATWANNHREEVPKGKWYAALGQTWVDSVGYHRVPRVCAGTVGVFRFGLGFFEYVWNGNCAFFCFCDQSLDTETLEKEADPLALPRELMINGITYIRK